MSERIEEGIGKWLFGVTKKPQKNDLVRLSDRMMNTAEEMDKFLNNITDNRKREVMKKNVTMIQQLLVDNLEIYNSWINQQNKGM